MPLHVTTVEESGAVFVICGVCQIGHYGKHLRPQVVDRGMSTRMDNKVALDKEGAPGKQCLSLVCSAIRQVQMMMVPLDPVFSSSLQLLVTDLLVLLLHEQVQHLSAWFSSCLFSFHLSF